MMIAVIVALLIFFLVVNGPAFRQKPNQVVVREHAGLGLGTPQPVVEKARSGIYMASESAYQKVAHVKKAGGYGAPNSALNVAEWMLWPSFLSKDMDA